MGGSGGQKSQGTVIQSSNPNPPPEVTNLLQTSVPEQQQVLNTGGGLDRFAFPNPEPVAQLTPQQQLAINQVQGQMNQPLLNSPEQLATAASAQNVLQAPGTSPATQLQQQVLSDQFNQTILPQLQSQASLAGLGRSGGYLDALAQAQTGQQAAMVPLLAQDAQLQQQAQSQGIQNLLGVGGTLEQRPTDRANAAFQAGEQQRQIQQQGFDTAQQDFLRQQQLTEDITQGALGIVPSVTGSSGLSQQRTYVPPTGMFGK